MTRLSLRNVSSCSAANGSRVAREGISRLGCATIAALVLTAGAFISIEPAAAANSGHAVYCLSGESQNDCGFTNLAQCEATASGGLGECKMVAAGPLERGPYAFYRPHSGAAHRSK